MEDELLRRLDAGIHKCEIRIATLDPTVNKDELVRLAHMIRFLKSVKDMMLKADSTLKFIGC